MGGDWETLGSNFCIWKEHGSLGGQREELEDSLASSDACLPWAWGRGARVFVLTSSRAGLFAQGRSRGRLPASAVVCAHAPSAGGLWDPDEEQPGMQGARAQQSGPGGHGACVWTALLVWLSILPVRAQDAENMQPIPSSPLPRLPSVATLTSGTTSTTQPLSKVCGKTEFAGKIFGGQEAGPGRWPWQASLLWKGVHICGAVLIDNYWVASAAHCFQRSRRPSDYRILLGYSQLSNPSNYSRHMTVNKVIIQENYNKFHHQRNDIALLQLHIPVDFNSHILPACIPENTTKHSCPHPSIFRKHKSPS